MARVINYPGNEANAAAAAKAGSKPIAQPEPLIKVQDIAYVLFEKPDLGKQLEFLQDFGMQASAQSDEAIFMRGCGPSPWFYAAYKGDQSRYLGMGLVADSADDLLTISNATGLAVTNIEEPGGGQRVRLLDPDGFIVDIVHGRTAVARTESRTQLFAVNTPADKARVNTRVSSKPAPSPLERLGHLVLAVTDFQVSTDWYLRHFGLIPTDVQCVGDGSPVLAFTRCDRGSTPADHHTVVLVQNFAAGCMHSAYETLDLDAVGQGSQHLYAKGWNHFWGIGRHILGSQIFDYWKDPFGDELEHYADGDMFDASFDTQYHAFDQGSLWAWGEEVPAGPKPGLITVLKLIFSKKGKAMPRRVLGQMRAALSIKPRPWMG